MHWRAGQRLRLGLSCWLLWQRREGYGLRLRLQCLHGCRELCLRLREGERPAGLQLRLITMLVLHSCWLLSVQALWGQQLSLRLRTQAHMWQVDCLGSPSLCWRDALHGMQRLCNQLVRRQWQAVSGGGPGVCCLVWPLLHVCWVWLGMCSLQL